jgi:diacylglycerol kinase family enzyme
MAGLGFDANVIRAADKHMKHVLGRMAYVWAAARNLRMDPFEARVDVDGKRFYKGQATLILFGNVGRAFAGLQIFEDARADDGLLEVGVADAEGIMQWGKTIARKHVANSPFVHMTQARSVQVKLQRKVRYEVDGSERTKEKAFEVEVEPGGISICVPAED